MDKVVATAAEAVADVTDGSSLAVGGFGFCGIPEALIAALLDSGVRDLETVSNNCGGEGIGVGSPLQHKRICRAVTLKLTGVGCVNRIITDLAVLDVTPRGLVIRELAPGVSVDEVRRRTDAPIDATSAAGVATAQ